MDELRQKILEIEERLEALEGLSPDYVPSDSARTIPEVAEAVGRPYQTVYSAVKAGILKGHKYMNRVFVEPEDLEAYKTRCEWMDKHNKKEGSK